MFKIYDEGACSIKIYEEPKSPNAEACLRYMMNRNGHMRGRV